MRFSTRSGQSTVRKLYSCHSVSLKNISQYLEYSLYDTLKGSKLS